jgi:hypothetical protein
MHPGDNMANTLRDYSTEQLAEIIAHHLEHRGHPHEIMQSASLSHNHMRMTLRYHSGAMMILEETPCGIISTFSGVLAEVF